MIFQGLVYMVLGMGVVFAFLVLLVVALRVTSRIASVLDSRYPLPDTQPRQPASAELVPAPGEGEEIAAALGAVVAYDPSLLQLIPAAPTGPSGVLPTLSGAYLPSLDEGMAADRLRRSANPWALSGRQASMKMRTLMQRGVLKR